MADACKTQCHNMADACKTQCLDMADVCTTKCIDMTDDMAILGIHSIALQVKKRYNPHVKILKKAKLRQKIRMLFYF